MSSSVGHNSLVMAAGTAASRITGQVRTILLAAAVGTTGLAANAYQAGSQIPQVIFTLVSGGIFNAVLVPQIVRTLKSKDAEEQLNKLITFAIVLLLAVTGIVAALAAPLTRLYVNGGSDLLALSTAFTLWCVPQIFFYGLYTVLGQILAAKDHFGTYAWSSVGANIISCIGFTAFIVLFGKADQQPLGFWTNGKIALSAGTWTLGVAFQALVLFLPLMRLGIHYRPRFGIHGIGLKQMGPVAAWSLGIVAVDQIATIINTRVTTSAPLAAHRLYGTSLFDVAGNASYQNAYTIYILPYSLIAVSVATAIFPRISQAIADHNIDGARAGLSQSLRNVWLLMCFFTAAFVVMPAPITLALLPSVSVKEALLMSGPLITLSFSLPLSAAYLIIQRTFYAFEDGYHPFLFIVLQAGSQVLMLLIGRVLIRPDNWVTMLGLTLSMSYLLPFPVLVIMIRKRFNGRLDGMRLFRTFSKGVIALAVAIVGGILLRYPAYTIFGANLETHSGHMNWAQAVGTCIVLALVVTLLYAGTLWVLRCDELVAGVTMVKRKLSQLTHRGESENTGVIHSQENGEHAATAPAQAATVRTPVATARNTAISARGMDRINLTEKPLVNRSRHGVGKSMEPQPGDVALNRYTLVSPLRSAPGLQAWKANDEVLARDCQLFIVTDHAAQNIASVASSLALSRSNRFTQVVRIESEGDAHVLVTHLDQGTALTDFLGHGNAKSGAKSKSDSHTGLGYEAMRAIIGETAEGLRQLLDDGITLHALTTDMVRLTSGGVQIADAPLSELFVDPLETPALEPEQVAVRQIAALLYAMLTNRPLDSAHGFDVSHFKSDVPEEFQVICQRGLTVKYEDDIPSISLVSVGELVGLLGRWKPLSRQNISTKTRGGNTIERIKLHGGDSKHIADLPKGLVAMAGVAEAASAADAATHATNAAGTTGATGKTSTAQGKRQKASAAPIDRNGKANSRKTGNTGNNGRNQKPVKPVPSAQPLQPAKAATASTKPVMPAKPTIPARPVEFAKSTQGTKPAAKTTQSTKWAMSGKKSKTSATPTKPSKQSRFGKSTKTRRNAQSTQGPAEVGLRGLAATEVADALKPIDSYAEDTLFPGFNDTGSYTNDFGQTVQLDFNGKAPQVHTDGKPGTNALEATGRIPIFGPDGMPIEPGQESARALKAEQAAQKASVGEIMPPSFTPKSTAGPESDESADSDDLADTPIFGKITTKVIAIVAVVVVVIAALGFAVATLHSRSEESKAGNHESQSSSSPWPDMDVNKVPFSGNADEDGNAANKKKHTSKKKSTKPAPQPAPAPNTTPYTVDNQQFLTNPDGQQGYGYYMHLSQPQQVSRFVITIRSSGGNAQLMANTSHDPRAGQQVAQFTFDQSGTTEVKLKKPVQAQDFILWVPIDALPNNQLYVEKVQFF